MKQEPVVGQFPDEAAFGRAWPREIESSQASVALGRPVDNAYAPARPKMNVRICQQRTFHLLPAPQLRTRLPRYVRIDATASRLLSSLPRLLSRAFLLRNPPRPLCYADAFLCLPFPATSCRPRALDDHRAAPLRGGGSLQGCQRRRTRDVSAPGRDAPRVRR
ncbi:hypothetical protein VTK56DRAFT_3157 [Thermocarpiscus australiensis]